MIICTRCNYDSHHPPWFMGEYVGVGFGHQWMISNIARVQTDQIIEEGSNRKSKLMLSSTPPSNLIIIVCVYFPACIFVYSVVVVTTNHAV